jgi:hypothetical protein
MTEMRPTVTTRVRPACPSRSATASAITSATTSPWRRLATTLIALSLGAVLTLSLADAAGAKERAASATPPRPKVSPVSGHGTARARGVVDMAKLPILQPHAVTSAQPSPLPDPDALTPAQRQGYNSRASQTRATATAP